MKKGPSLKTYYVLLPDGTYDYVEASSHKEAIEGFLDPADFTSSDQFLVFLADDSKTFVPNCITEFKEEE